MTTVKIKPFVLLGVCATSVCLSGCGSSKTPTGGGDKSPQQVRVSPALEQKITDTIELVARTQADASVTIRSRVSGFLQETHFEDGQQVNEGDLLFSIEPDEYQAILNQANAQIDVALTKLELAQKTFTRSSKLLEANAVSQEEYDQNKAAVAEARAMVKAAQADAARVQLDVDYTKITSPITGRIDRALLDEGNYVTGGLTGGTALADVVSSRPMKAVANVDENVRLQFMRRQREIAGADFKEADRLAEMQIPCELQLPDEDDFPRKGVLDYAEVKINQTTGTSQIRGVFPNDDGLLKAGMFVRLRIPVSDEYAAVMVPDLAIGTDQTTKFVLVVNDQNQVEERTITTGSRRGTLRIVRSGLNAGERVIVAGMQLVRPGATVDAQTVTETEPSQAAPPDPPVDEATEDPALMEDQQAAKTLSRKAGSLGRRA
ncbi:MAG: efflux RND transporter periplasmic adaptor subunit [Planctomycetota bacterium]